MWTFSQETPDKRRLQLRTGERRHAGGGFRPPLRFAFSPISLVPK
jgi:hypothetical protein